MQVDCAIGEGNQMYWIKFTGFLFMSMATCIVHAGGIINASGYGTSQAEACERALNEASSRLRGNYSISVTEKKCQCSKGEKQQQNSKYKDISALAQIQQMESWNCTGFVSYVSK